MRATAKAYFLTVLFGLTSGCTHREHPYLAFDAAQIPELRERTKQKPYKAWMAAVEANAKCGLSFVPGSTSNKQCPSTSTVPPGLTCPWSSANVNESCQSGYAFNMALANTIHPNAEYVAQIVNLLMNAGKYEKNWNNAVAGGWYWGSDLQNYAYAYDMVQPQLTSSQNKAIIEILAGLVNRTMLPFADPTNIAYVTNVRLRVGGGAGTLAMALDGHALTPLWADTIERSLFGDGRLNSRFVDKYVATEVTPEGTLNEGPSYQNDAFAIMLPYMFVLKRLEGRDYFTGTNTLPPWKGDNRLAKMYERNAALSMPDNNSATFGTGWRSGFTLGNVSAPGLPQPADQQLEWFFAWQEGSGSINQIVPGLSFLYVNAQLPRTPPPWTSLVTPDWTSFRTGWDHDASYFLMQSEYWPEYSAHGQPDQTSFILYAKNRYLLLDPGDGRNYCNSGSGCTQALQINRSPEAHNLVIVDGNRGCDQNKQTPARLRGYYNVKRDPISLLAAFVTKELSSSMLTLQENKYFSVPDVTTYRTAMMVRGRYFLIFDGMVASGQTPHTYDALLHFGGPLTNTSDVCQSAQSGASESCGADDADKLCWEEPKIEETEVPEVSTESTPGDGGTTGIPLSCRGNGTGLLGAGVTDCGSVVGTLDMGNNGSDRLKWSTKSNSGAPIELSSVYAPAPVRFTTDNYPTNFYPNAVFTHPFIRARYDGLTTQWLNVLYPRNVDPPEPTPTIISQPVTGGNGAAMAIKLDAETIDDLAVVSDGNAAIIVANEVGFQGRAAMLLRTGGKLVRANIHEAQSFSIKGEVVFSAKQPAHASISWANDVASAEIDGSRSNRVCLLNRSSSGTLLLDGRPVETTREGTLLCIDVSNGKHILNAH